MKKEINYYIIAYFNGGKDQLKWRVELQDVNDKIKEIKRYNGIEKIEIEKEIITKEIVNEIKKENF